MNHFMKCALAKTALLCVGGLGVTGCSKEEAPPPPAARPVPVQPVAEPAPRPLPVPQPVQPAPVAAPQVKSLLDRARAGRGTEVRVNSKGQVVGLSLKGLKLEEADWQELTALEQLESLNLSGTNVRDEDMDHVAGLSKLSALDLNQTAITDAGLARLEGMDSLQYLYLGGTGITDAGLEHLARLKKLERLHIWETEVKGPGLAKLAGLPIRELRVNKSAVDNKGLLYLRGWKNLHVLETEGTPVTDEGITELKKALPQVQANPIINK